MEFDFDTIESAGSQLSTRCLAPLHCFRKRSCEINFILICKHKSLDRSWSFEQQASVRSRKFVETGTHGKIMRDSGESRGSSHRSKRESRIVAGSRVNFESMASRSTFQFIESRSALIPNVILHAPVSESFLSVSRIFASKNLIFFSVNIFNGAIRTSTRWNPAVINTRWWL